MKGILCNLHTHTVFSDGLGEGEDFVRAALEEGLKSLGFSDHAYAPYDPDCCIKEGDIPRYFAEMQRLRESWKPELEIYIGFENDCYHPAPRDGLDYTIGSVHYLRDESTGEYHCVDYLASSFEKALACIGGGDIRRMMAVYYELIGDMATEQAPDIIGHLDLITKLNRDCKYFDPDSGWYLDMLEDTLRAIRQSGSIIEVNTGGMARGYTSVPYPGKPILEQIRSMGIPVMVSSDAHAPENLTAHFDETAALLSDIGFISTRQLIGGAFVDVPL